MTPCLRKGLKGLTTLVFMGLTGCGLSDTDERERANAPQQLANARAVLYEYCLLELRADPLPDRSQALVALQTLGQLYRSEPNTPFPGEDRDQVRLVVKLAARELDTCDPELSNRARSLLRP